MPTLATNQTHPIPTRRSRFVYEFTQKHHGCNKWAAQWRLDLSLDEEFAVFDAADSAKTCDDDGKLYGILPRTADGKVPALGTRGEQFARFECHVQQVWHGYPFFPVRFAVGPKPRFGGNEPPPREVLFRLEAAGVISATDRRRIRRGKHI